MKITLHTIKIRDVVDDFCNNEEEGVTGYGGLLNIRPKYQREFVYNEKQEKAVIESIFKGFPLNVMYWVKNEDGTFDLLDGQQRTLSICNFYEGSFFLDINGTLKSFDNLTGEERNQFLDYQLQIYICEDGTEAERLDWFKIINIAGEKLTDQELLNAVYTGKWLMTAKKRFSKSTCVAYQLAKDYMTGSPIRQDYLATVLKWISGNKVEEYMAKHQKDANSDVEWEYFQNVFHWVKTKFPKYRSTMKGLPWGELYNKYKDVTTKTSSELEAEVARLMIDDDVTNKKGIYEYVLSGDERYLNIRGFSDAMRIEAYERQHGVCPICGNYFEIGEMEADHITPWSEGGKTNAENCQMLCRECNRRKSNK